MKSSSRPVVFYSLWGPTFLLLGTGTPKRYMFLLLALTMTLMSNFRWYWNLCWFTLLGGPDVLFSAQIVRTYDPRGNIPASHGCISRAELKPRYIKLCVLKSLHFYSGHFETLLYELLVLFAIFFCSKKCTTIYSPPNGSFCSKLWKLWFRIVFLRHIAEEARNCDLLVLWLDCDRTDLGVVRRLGSLVGRSRWRRVFRGEGENICFEVLELALPQMKLGYNLALPHVGVDVDIDN